jgi:hypothetical protein
MIFYHQHSYNYEKIFIVICLDEANEYCSRSVKLKMCRVCLFAFLIFIGSFGNAFFIDSYYHEYLRYPRTHNHRAKLKPFLAGSCSNHTDLSCSFQAAINVYLLRIKLFLVYYSSMIIGMIYTWHRTVRLSSCLSSVYIIIIILFGTDLILYLEHIGFISFFICFHLFYMFLTLEALLPHDVENPLRFVCGYDVSLNNLDAFLQNDTSKRARFYRWVQKMKHQWNIKDEKLIITIFVVMTTTVINTVMYMHVLS